MSEVKNKPFKREVAKVVTLPLFKWTVGVELCFSADSPIFKGKEIKGVGDAAKMEPADLMNVTNLETGEQGQIIVGAVLKGIMEETYPDAEYVGKRFAVTQSKVDGKRYKAYQVLELV